jgi:hypothetical protein
MKLSGLVFFLLITLNGLIAQSFDRKVIASAGKETSNGSALAMNAMYMTYTIGEPIIYKGSNSTFQLNNGFIQPYPNATINPITPSGMMQAKGELVVYPNPFGTFIMVNGPSENEEEVKVQLIDLQGKLVLDQQILPKFHKLEIPEHCSPGTYLLNFYSLQGQFLQQIKMIKMNYENK